MTIKRVKPLCQKIQNLDKVRKLGINKHEQSCIAAKYCILLVSLLLSLLSLLFSLLWLSILTLSSLKNFPWNTQKKIQPSKLKTVEASFFVVVVNVVIIVVIVVVVNFNIVITQEFSLEHPKKNSAI